MKAKRKVIICILSSMILFVMILDAKTVFAGAYNGIEICLRTVLPSLFPFIFISCILNGSIGEVTGKFLRPLGKLCRIPNGCESLLLLGLLGGYPVGAKCIAESYESGCICKDDAQRLLGFCNNAGPAFIFGMVGTLFQDMTAAWLIWGIHIVSALFTGLLLPGGCHKNTASIKRPQITLTSAVERSIKTMLTICGWVTLFRVLLTLLEKWILWILPSEVRIAIAGILELSNGIINLNGITVAGKRFVLASCFLAYGGVCVLTQTHSVIGELRLSWYFPGKAIQSVISFLLAYMTQSIIFTVNDRWNEPSVLFIILLPMLTVSLFFLKRAKKVVAFC